MKKEILKVGIIFVVVIGLVVWGLNYIFFNQNAPRSKAAGETMSLSFNPALVTTAAVNQDFTVSIIAKPSINALLRGYKTRVNFDKTKLSFKSIQYKVGVVSAGLGNTTPEVVNGQGYIDIIGEDTAAIGSTLTSANGLELASITFTNLSATGASLLTSNAAFYSINSDMSLYDGWTVAAQSLDINGGGIIPTSAPTGSLSPTISSGATGNVKLNLKLKFQGINKLPATGENTMVVKVKVQKEGDAASTDGSGTFISDANGIWSGTVGVNIAAISGKYKIMVKGAQHIQKKICDSAPTEPSTGPGTYRCSNAAISLAAGDNNLNFSGILLLSGDLDQSGIVDSVDFGLVKNNLGKTDAATLAKADINRDGKVDTQDFSLIIAALGVRTDEL